MSVQHKVKRVGKAELNSPVNKQFNRRQLLASGVATAAALMFPELVLAQAVRPKLQRIAVQYIAALGANDAKSGDNAQEWGLWRKDPGPRGVDLDDFEKLKARGGVAPANWTFDNQDWWLEEHGLIMEQPEFPIPAGYYFVTGGREVATVLTVHPAASDGSQRWELDDGASIYDVTHLRCRSGRYTPAQGAGSCSPAQAQQSAFPVRPGAAMPAVSGCAKQDYAVFIVTAFAAY
jgi:hypothetical protein